jgi:hypothetical protein
VSDLVSDLREAASLLRDEQPSCGFSAAFDSFEEFADALDRLASVIDRGSRNPLLWPQQVYLRLRAKIWFMPTCDWDDVAWVAGEKAVELGNRIYGAL